MATSKVDALTAYVMSPDPEVVEAARQELDARVKDGERDVFFRRSLTPREQREAGMLPPSQRNNPQTRVDDRPQLANLDDESLEKLRDLLDAETERRWTGDSAIEEDTTEADLADYAARTDNVLSQSAVDAMDEKQRDLFIKAGANAAFGKSWESGNAKWQRGETA